MRTTTLLVTLIILLLVTPTLPHVVAGFGVNVDALCKVVRVVDGDTIDVVVLHVFNEKYSMLTGREVRIRFADINAPEIYTIEGKAAKDFLYNLVNGKHVYLDIDDLYVYDRYGRVVAVVYLPVNKTTLLNVNLYLVAKGYAEIRDYPNEFYPQTWRLYVSLEAEKQVTITPSSPATTRTITITHIVVETVKETKTTTTIITKTIYTTLTTTYTKTIQSSLAPKTITATRTVTITTVIQGDFSLNPVIIAVLALSIALNIALLYRVKARSQ